MVAIQMSTDIPHFTLSWPWLHSVEQPDNSIFFVYRQQPQTMWFFNVYFPEYKNLQEIHICADFQVPFMIIIYL